MIEPVVLADAATLTVAAPIVTLDAAKMTPPSNRPMLVRDICISVRAASAGVAMRNPAISLMIKIEAGRFVVTQGFVPAWLLGPVFDKKMDYGIKAQILGSLSVGNIFQDTARLKWILPKPMYLPPNAQVKVTLQQLPLFTQAEGAGFSLLTNVSARGLLLEQQQRTTDVPFVSAFVPAVGQLQSNQQDLCNVLDKPLTLHRLIGRIGWFNTPTGATNPQWTTTQDDAIGFRGDEGGGDPAQAIQRLIAIRLRDSMGVAMTSGPTSEYAPFWTVFAPGSNAWTMKRVLQANEHFTATLSRAPTATQRPMISMVGHRTERI